MRRQSIRGMTIVELMLCIAVTAAAMGLIVLTSNSLREDIAKQRTRDMLRTLQKALGQYHQATGDWPTGTTPEVLRTLLTDAATRETAEVLRLDPNSSFVRVLDGYDRPFKYQRPQSGGQKPAQFVSAGPDGQFGDADSEDQAQRAAEVDNLYGSEIEVILP